MAEQVLQWGLHQVHNKQLQCRYDVTAAILGHKRSMIVVQNADVARPWLVACACLCLPHDVQPASAIEPAGGDRKGNERDI